MSGELDRVVLARRLFDGAVADVLAQLDGDLPSDAPDDVDPATLDAYRTLCGHLRAAVIGAAATLTAGLPGECGTEVVT